MNQVILRSRKGEIERFLISSYTDEEELEESKIHVIKEVDDLVEKSWGKFAKSFIIQHIINADILKTVTCNKRLVAIASASRKRYSGKQVLYLEFTVASSKYQGFNLTTLLNGDIVSNELLRKARHGRLLSAIFGIDVVTITRNPRVVGALAGFASWMYPDPKKFADAGILHQAPKKSWDLAQNIVRESWNPTRRLDRTGLVLHGSYENSPWLIPDSVQRHHSSSATKMTDKLLGLSRGMDRELLVHAKMNYISVLKYHAWKKRITDNAEK